MSTQDEKATAETRRHIQTARERIAERSFLFAGQWLARAYEAAGRIADSEARLAVCAEISSAEAAGLDAEHLATKKRPRRKS